MEPSEVSKNMVYLGATTGAKPWNFVGQKVQAREILKRLIQVSLGVFTFLYQMKGYIP